MSDREKDRVDQDLLERFEDGLDTRNLTRSRVEAKILGYGEISTVFQIRDDEGRAWKRMPFFRDRESAEQYLTNYTEYCRLLAEAGLRLPETDTVILERAVGPVVFYIGQRMFPAGKFGHGLIHALDQEETHRIMERIVGEIGKVWAFNRARRGDVELALDGQLSNWVAVGAGNDEVLFYTDTSTPLFRIREREQLDPDLFLVNVPTFMRWIVRRFFLDGVMTRYYSPRKVYIDLAANLYKEQRSDLIPTALAAINDRLDDVRGPISAEEVRRYYREDRVIWSVFLALRRFDRWMQSRILGRPYDFILPGKIRR
ncbi:DUF6206 family protein [Thermodesulfobacteriota bacterium]